MHPGVPMQRDAFLARVRGILDRVEEYAAVDGVSHLWNAVESTANAVLAAHIAAASDDANLLLPDGIGPDGIPEGFRRCVACKKILRICTENFRRDKEKKSGFMGRCKSCMPKRKRGPKRAREDDAAKLVQPVNRTRIEPQNAVVVERNEIPGENDEVRENPEADIERVVMEEVLDQDGFQLYPKTFAISADLVEKLRHYAMNGNGEEVFNNAEAGDTSNDQRRSQILFKSFMEENKELQELHDHLTMRVGSMFEKHSPQDMVILRSDPGCLPQRAHTDYTAAAFRRVKGGNVPLACVIALMDDTYFDVWPGAIQCFNLPAGDARVFHHRRLKLNAGDMLIFRGDLVHAGSAFSQFNIRLHMYLDIRGVRREPDTTFYMDELDYIRPRIE